MTKRASSQTPSDPTAPGAWMTVEEVCDLLGETRSTLDKWRKRPEVGFPVPKRMPNATIRYSRAAMSAWLDGLADAA